MGALFEAVIVVVVSISELTVVLAGQASARLFASTDPNPVAWSYPVPALKPAVPLQFAATPQSLFPDVMSWNADA